MQRVVEMIAERAALHPQRTALIAGPLHVTYGELWDRIGATAARFLRLGIRQGDTVMVAGLSQPSFVYAYFACHLAGATAIPFDPEAPAPRRDDLIARACPRLILGADKIPQAASGLAHNIEELTGAGPRDDSERLPALDSVADLLFTTGTTGRPKGVRLTHRNIATAARHINAVIQCDEGDVEVLPLPLYAAFGLGRLRCGLAAGRGFVLIDGFRLPGEIFAALETHRAAALVAVPAGFALLLRFGARGLAAYADQLRYIEIGSAPMPLEQKRTLMEMLPRTRLWMHY